MNLCGLKLTIELRFKGILIYDYDKKYFFFRKRRICFKKEFTS